MTIDHDDLLAEARTFLLASMLVAYPDDALVETIDVLPPSDLCAPMQRALAQHGLDAVQSVYLDLFDRKVGGASLCETEYGHMRGIAKGNELADIAGFYNAFGLTLDDHTHELIDHLAIELEFYGTLLLKQAILMDAGDTEGGDIVKSARKKFLNDHLGRFVRALADHPAVQSDATYGPTLDDCATLVARACHTLDITPPPLNFFATISGTDNEVDANAFNCGCVPLLVPPTELQA